MSALTAGEINVLLKARDELSGPLKHAAQETQGFGSKFKGMVGGMASGLATFGLAANGVKILGGAVMSFVKAADEGALVAADTANTIKTTGGAANVTADQVAKLADSIELHTKFSAESVQAGENMLLTFTNVKNVAGEGNDIFNQSTKIMVDMAQKMGTDAGGAAIQLGKALNDPTKGITALTRVGVTFTEEQKAQIKAMQDSGDMAGAQKVILAELTKEFGGTAEAAGKTLPGALAILRNRFGNIQETLAGALVPKLTELAVKAVPLVDAAVTKLTNVLPIVSEKMTEIASVASGPLHAGLDKVRALVTGPLHTGFVILRDGVLTFKEALSGNWTNSDQVLLFHRIIGNLGTLIRSVILPAWGHLSDAIGVVRDHFAGIMAVVQPILTILGGPFHAVLMGMLRGFGKEGLSGILPGAIQGLKDFGQAFLSLGGIILNALGKVDWGSVASGVMTALGEGLAKAGDIGTSLLGSIASALTGADWSGIAGTIWSGIVAGLTALANAGADLLSWLGGVVTGVNWSGLAGSIWSGIVAGFFAITDAGARLLGWLVGVVTSVDWSGLASSIWGGIVTGFYAVTDAGARFVAWLQSTLTGVDWSGIATTISGGITGALQSAQSAVQGGGLLDSLGLSSDKVQGILDSLKPFTDFLSGQFAAIIENFRQTVSGVGDAFKGIDLSEVLPALKTLGEVIGVLVGTYITVMVIQLRVLSEVLSVVLPAAATIVVGAINIIAITINTVVDVIKGVVKLVSDLFHGDWSAAWGDAQGIAQSFSDGMNGIMGALVDTVVGLFGDLAQKVLAALEGLATDALGKAQSVASNIISGIESIVTDGPGKVGEMALSMLAGIGQLELDALAAAGRVATSIVDGIKTIVTDGPQKITDMATGIGAEMTILVGQALTAAGFVASAIINGIKTIVEDAPGKVVDMGAALVTALSGAGGIAETIVSEGAKIGGAILGGIASGLADFIGSGLDAAINAVADHIPGWLKKLWGIASPAAAFIPIGMAATEGIGVGFVQGAPQAAIQAGAAGQMIAASFVGGAAGGSGNGLGLGRQAFHDYLFNVYGNGGVGAATGLAAGMVAAAPLAAQAAGAAGNVIGSAFAAGAAAGASGSPFGGVGAAGGASGNGLGGGPGGVAAGGSSSGLGLTPSQLHAILFGNYGQPSQLQPTLPPSFNSSPQNMGPGGIGAGGSANGLSAQEIHNAVRDGARQGAREGVADAMAGTM